MAFGKIQFERPVRKSEKIKVRQIDVEFKYQKQKHEVEQKKLDVAFMEQKMNKTYFPTDYLIQETNKTKADVKNAVEKLKFLAKQRKQFSKPPPKIVFPITDD
jgi:hypothetical protein